jgi:hypothetical protein
MAPEAYLMFQLLALDSNSDPDEMFAAWLAEQAARADVAATAAPAALST